MHAIYGVIHTSHLNVCLQLLEDVIGILDPELKPTDSEMEVVNFQSSPCDCIEESLTSSSGDQNKCSKDVSECHSVLIVM